VKTLKHHSLLVCNPNDNHQPIIGIGFYKMYTHTDVILTTIFQVNVG